MFICEGMYGEQDKEQKAKAYKHMTFQEAATLAKEAQVRDCLLYTSRPSRGGQGYYCHGRGRTGCGGAGIFCPGWQADWKGSFLYEDSPGDVYKRQFLPREM